MQYNKVEISGIVTSKLKVLKESEKIRLIKELREGNKEARETLVNGNLKLVLSVVQRFAGRGEDPDDLFQIGVIGLIKAIDNFDVSLNVRFSTYAVPMIVEGGENNIIVLKHLKRPWYLSFLDVFIFHKITLQFQVYIDCVVFINNNTFNKFRTNRLFLFLCHTWKCIFDIF